MERVKKTKESTSLLTAYKIAKQINRSLPAVLEKIKSLGIKPEMKVGGNSYYHPDNKEKIATSMRKPNQ